MTDREGRASPGTPIPSLHRADSRHPPPGVPPRVVDRLIEPCPLDGLKNLQVLGHVFESLVEFLAKFPLFCSPECYKNVANLITCSSPSMTSREGEEGKGQRASESRGHPKG